jgi:carboxymethylenebutenolidase
MTEQHLEDKNGIAAGFVDYAGNGNTIDGYLARPTDGRPHPGVILIQEWWGIDAHIKELTERLAGEGYVVLAPDLYHGKVAQEPDEAMKITMTFNQDQAIAEIRQAIDYLQSRDDVQPKQLGVTGFCMGGRLVWRVAELENGELAAIAPFYAGRYNPSVEDIRKVTAPALVVWGEQDQSIPADQREHITRLLEQEGKVHQIRIYPAGHAFLNNYHPTYNAEAAQQAWSELLAWFKQYLG